MASNKIEDMVREMFGKQLIEAMRNKDKIAAELMRILDDQGRVQRDMDKIVKAIDDGDDVNVLKAVRALCRSSNAQANAIRQMSMTCLIYICGGDFDADCAKLANTFGMGAEALRQMFKNKMQGTGRRPFG